MIFLYLLLGLLFLFAVGPRPKVELFWDKRFIRTSLDKPVEDLTSGDLKRLRERIIEQELAVPNVVDGAEKHIAFSSESRPRRTKYCVLYLHGFSATRQEISPVSETVANALHANFYATRLTGHGLDGEQLAKSSPNDWIFDLIEAWEVAKQLGEQVIVISTSTGGTLATWLAQQEEAKRDLAALVMISPNFQSKHLGSTLFLLPWSKYWLPIFSGPTRSWEPTNEATAKYWTYSYPMTIIYELTAFVKAVRYSDIESITAPSLFIYSDADAVVNSKHTDLIARRWGSRIRHRIAVPAKERDNNHVITGDITNPETTEQVIDDILLFLKRNLKSI